MEPRTLSAEAHLLEQKGQLDEALKLYLQAGAADDAARILTGQGRFGEAGKVLLQSLGNDVSKLAGLDPARRKRALMAGICFGRAGDTAHAVSIFMQIDERGRAVEALQNAGDLSAAARVEAGEALDGDAYAVGREGGPVVSVVGAQKLEHEGKLEPALEAYVALKQYGHAGRVAHRLGRVEQAAELFLHGGMPYEAAVCYQDLGDTGKCLENLVRVPRDDKRYRNAAQNAVRVAGQLNLIDFALDSFLGRFVDSGPQDDREADAFYLLGDLYARHDFLDNAKDTYLKLLARKPGYRDVEARLASIANEARGSAMVYEKILKEEEAFRVGSGRTRPPVARSSADEGELPELPSLPDLPSTPSGPVAAAPRGPAAPAASGRVPTVSARVTGMSQAAMPPLSPSPTLPPSGGVVAQTMPSQSSGVARPAGRPSIPSAAPVPVSVSFAASGGGVPVAMAEMRSSGMLAEGILVNERYRLEKKIGQGGMGSVYRAHDLELDELIAIKFFAAAMADETTLQRFRSEVTLSRKLNHPNVIRLYDIGTYADYKYISMELLTGSDLGHAIDGKVVDFRWGIDILVQACKAVQVVHDAGVIHRDIKPDNFFVSTEGVLKVMDFGIAKRPTQRTKTVAGMLAGTPEYMSPEQVNDFASVTRLTDLYALGIIAYQMFTGTLPFFHEELMPLLVMHVTQEPEPPSRRNPGISSDLEDIILQLLAKDPTMRIQSCRELASRLSEVKKRLPAAPRK